MIENKSNNQHELDLIESLREAVSKELKLQVSNKKLGTLLISANRFNRIIREQSVLKRNSLDKIERNVKLLIKNEGYKKIALTHFRIFPSRL